MKNKNILIFSVLAVGLFYGCVKELKKEGVYEKTTLKGRVVEESGNAPMDWVTVQVTDDESVIVQTTTNDNGEFSLEVDYGSINPDSYLYMERQTDSSVAWKKLSLKGVGKSEYNYGNIFFSQSIPEVETSAITNVLTNSAVCGGNIISDGGKTIIRRGICWSTSGNPQVDLNETVDASNLGIGSYTCTMTGLTPNTTYFVRAFAVNTEGLSYGEKKTFTTPQYTLDGWLAYGQITSVTSWGLTNGGIDEWAVMFPANLVSEYAGWYITKVKVCFEEIETYTLRIYEGGITSPSLLKKTGVYDISSTGWKNLLVEPGYALNASTSLWISLGLEYEAGLYPKCAVGGINNHNARWGHVNNGQWYDVYNNNGGEDLCWTIRAYVTDGAKEKELEMGLPANLMSDQDAPSVAPLKSWDGYMVTPDVSTMTQTKVSDKRKP